METKPCCTHVFLRGTRGSMSVAKWWKMTPGAEGLWQAKLSSKSKGCMVIAGWLFEWSQVRRTWKRTVFKRFRDADSLSKNGAKTGEWWSKETPCVGVSGYHRASSDLTRFASKSYGYLSTTRKPKTRTVRGIVWLPRPKKDSKGQKSKLRLWRLQHFLAIRPDYQSTSLQRDPVVYASVRTREDLRV